MMQPQLSIPDTKACFRGNWQRFKKRAITPSNQLFSPFERGKYLNSELQKLNEKKTKVIKSEEKIKSENQKLRADLDKSK